MSARDGRLNGKLIREAGRRERQEEKHVAQVWNRMVDPGDGSLHQQYNFTLLKYAGNGKFSFEEDIYNPAHFQSMIKGWSERKRELVEKGGGGAR